MHDKMDMRDGFRLFHDAVKDIGLQNDFNSVLDATLTWSNKTLQAKSTIILLSDSKSPIKQFNCVSDKQYPPLVELKVEAQCIVDYQSPLNTNNLQCQNTHDLQMYHGFQFSPMIVEGTLIGLFGVMGDSKLDPLTLELFCALASIAAIGISQIDMRKKALEEQARKQYLSRYFSPDAVNYLMNKFGSTNMVNTGERKDVSILFCDIRGFTGFSEHQDPKDIFVFLDEYFELISSVIFRYRGMIDKLMGDGLLAVFGAFGDESNHALQAAECALEMHQSIQASKLTFGGSQPFEIGIGIHSGPVVLGDVGGSMFSDFTVLGSTVNTASRIEAMTKPLNTQILLSGDTYRRIKSDVIVQSIEPQVLRGMSKETKLYSLLSLE